MAGGKNIFTFSKFRVSKTSVFSNLFLLAKSKSNTGSPLNIILLETFDLFKKSTAVCVGQKYRSLSASVTTLFISSGIFLSNSSTLTLYEPV